MARAARDIRRIVVHCSDSAWGCAEEIDGWHRARGWDGIGYHYVINNGRPEASADYRAEWDGRLEVGRPHEVQGAHVRGHNGDTLGVCLIGTGEGLFTPLQVERLGTLVKWLQGLYGIPNSGVVGHRELDDGKTCPGFDVGRWIGRDVAA